MLHRVGGFPGDSGGKESACNSGNQGSIPGWGKILWRKKWQLTPVILPGESHGQSNLAGYITVHGVKKSWTRLSSFTYTE